MYQIQVYLDQIQWVASLERIKQYMRGVFGIMLKWLCKQDLPEELDEGETLASHKQKELEDLQELAKMADIPAPIGYDDKASKY